MTRVSLYFPWRSEYNRNLKEMDNQHISLVSLINDLQGAVNEGEGSDGYRIKMR